MKYVVMIFASLGISLFNLQAFAMTNHSSSWIDSEVRAITSSARNISPIALRTGLIAYETAKQHHLESKPILTLIDYSKPSDEKRLWVIDLHSNHVLFNTLVAHGKNSGYEYSDSFSNRMNSLKSSLGVFITENSYFGHDGYSLRVNGLEPGFNDNARRRDVVFHGAAYVSPELAHYRGTIGRSWGCMAVSRDVITPLVNTIKNHTLVVAYYPDRYWLRNSAYLRSYEA